MTTKSLAGWARNIASGLLDADFDINDYWVVTGSGFGTKDNSYRFHQDFNALAINADVLPSNNAAGTGLKLYQGGGSSIDTGNPHSGSKCWKTRFTGSQQTPRLGLDTGRYQKKLYYSCWWRYHVNSYTGNADWKFGRMGNTAEPYSASRFDHEFTGAVPPSSPSMNTSVQVGGPPPPNGTGAIYNPEWAGNAKNRAGHTFIFPQPDTWYFYQMYGDSGDYLTNNNYFEVFLNGSSNKYFDGSGTNLPERAFRNVDYPNMLRSLLLPNTGIVNFSSNDIEQWVDEVVVSSGWANAIMTDNPVYGQTLGTDKCVQLVDAYWSDDTLLFRPVFGVFTSGESAYIHIIDDNLNYSQTIPVVVP